VVIIQEYFIDLLESYVVFSPFNIPELKISINGQESSTMSFLSSGFVNSIIVDLFPMLKTFPILQYKWVKKNATTSLLTVAFQLLMPGPKRVNLDGVNVVVDSLTTVTNNITDALINA
jgi:homeobox-leucine zipper protein